MQSLLSNPGNNKRRVTEDEVERVMQKYKGKVDYLKPIVSILIVPATDDSDTCVNSICEIIELYYLGGITEYHLLSGYTISEDTVPRYLTDDEIRDIISRFPRVSSATADASEVSRKMIILNLVEQLRSIKIVPHPNALRVLSDTINDMYISSLMHPGDVVNTICADAFGSTATQMTLDTFKMAGALHSIGSGIQSLISLIYAINKVDAPCSVHFNVIVNARDVFDMRCQLVDVNVGDVTLSHDIYYRDGVSDIPDDSETLKFEWWHDLYFKTHQPLTPDYRNVLRLRLDTKKMYEHRITMEMISSVVNRGSIGVFVCVPSPFHIGILDIYVDSLQASRMLGAVSDVSHITILYINNIFKDSKDAKNPPLSKRRIKGIPGITDLYPVETNTISLISSTLKLNPREKLNLHKAGFTDAFKEIDQDKDSFYNKTYKVYIDKRQEKQSGMDIGRLFRLMDLSGMRIYHVERNLHKEITQVYIYSPTGKQPTEVISRYIEENKGDKYVSGISKYVYAMTVGSNMTELLRVPWIDKNKLSISNTHHMNYIYGCESARMHSINELMRIMDNNRITISSRHITLLTDFMYTRGVFLGMTHYGIEAHSGPISSASLERSGTVLGKAAIHGEKELRTTTSSVATGQAIPIGSNYYLNVNSPSAVQKFRESLVIKREKQARAERIGPNIKISKAISQREQQSVPRKRDIYDVDPGAHPAISVPPSPMTVPVTTTITENVSPNPANVFEIVPIDEDGNEIDIGVSLTNPPPHNPIMSSALVKAIDATMDENPILGFRSEALPDNAIPVSVVDIDDGEKASYSMSITPVVVRFNTGIPLDVLPTNLRPPVRVRLIPPPSLDLTYEDIVSAPKRYKKEEPLSILVSLLKKLNTA